MHSKHPPCHVYSVGYTSTTWLCNQYTFSSSLRGFTVVFHVKKGRCDVETMLFRTEKSSRRECRQWHSTLQFALRWMAQVTIWMAWYHSTFISEATFRQCCKIWGEHRQCWHSPLITPPAFHCDFLLNIVECYWGGVKKCFISSKSQRLPQGC